MSADGALGTLWVGRRREGGDRPYGTHVCMYVYVYVHVYALELRKEQEAWLPVEVRLAMERVQDEI